MLPACFRKNIEKYGGFYACDVLTTLTRLTLRIYYGYTPMENIMIAQIKKWGNSQGLRLTKQLLSDAQISVGDTVDVDIQKGQIVIAPVKSIEKKHNLQELVSLIPDDFQASEINWGEPIGKETW